MRNGVRLWVWGVAISLPALHVRVVTSFVLARPKHGRVPCSTHRPSRHWAVLVNTTEYDYFAPIPQRRRHHDELDRPKWRMQEILQQPQKTPLRSDYDDVTESHEEGIVSSLESCVSSSQPPPLLSNVCKARFLLLGAAALYGTNFSVVKLLDHSMPVGVSSTLRFGMAAMATLPWLLMSDDKQEGELATLGATIAGFEVGMWNSVGYVAQAIGLETMDASKSAFICSLAVVTVPILDLLVGKRMLPREILGAVLALTGVGFLEGFLSGGDVMLSSGDMASLLQPLTFGIGFWRMEQAMHKYPDAAGRLTAAQLLAVFVTSAVYCAATPFFGGRTPLPDWTQMGAWLTDPAIMGALFWTGVITTALTVYMETLALKTLSAAETTLLFSTEPLWGAACAAVLMGEQFGLDAAMGATLILSGCVISNLNLKLFGKDDEREGQTTIPNNTLVSDTTISPSSTSLVPTGLATGSVLATLQESEQIVDVVSNSLSS